MYSRRRNPWKAISGLLLVTGALAGILYWNSATAKGRRAQAADLQPAPPAAGGPSSLAPTASPGSGLPPGPAPVATTLPSASVTALLSQAQQLAATQPVQARTLVNNALPTLAGADVGMAKAYLRDLNAELLFSPTLHADDPATESVTIRKGLLLTKIANQYLIPHELILKINGLADARKLRVGQTLKVIKGPFHAVVDKTNFTLDVYLNNAGGAGSLYVTTYRVGLGTDNSTPTGLWAITPQNKVPNPTYYSPRGEGVIAAGDPNNPLGPFWLGLTGLEGQAQGKHSYGIHGTTDPASIGHQSSMGCIRLRNDDVAQVYALLFEGKSTVKVVD